jgi:hypothetical protein
MRLVKMLGLAMVAAIAAMALVGASSASAETLCSENANPCPIGKRYASGTVIKAHSEKAVLKGFATVTCKSDVAGELTQETGAPLNAKMTSLTFSNCEGCTEAKALNLPYRGLMHLLLATSLSHLLVHEWEAGTGRPGAVLKNCPLGISECVFSVSEEPEAGKPKSADLMIEGGNPASVKTGAPGSTTVKLERTGGSAFCGSTATWEATYTQTAPATGIWLAMEP